MLLSANTVTLIETWVTLLDTKIEVGKLKIGIDPLFSLLPGVGAFIPTIFTLVLIVIAVVARAPFKIIMLMIGYMFIDLLISQLPILGLPIDAVFHANAKSWYLLKPFVTDRAHISDKFDETGEIIEGELIK